jgi:hypothetical protein
MADTDLTPLELRIALLWEANYNTHEIAKVQGMPDWITEAYVHRLLPSIREKRRRCRGMKENQ